MQELLRWLASWKDVPVEPGTDLHVEFSGFPSGGMGLLVLLAVAAAIAIVIYAYRRDGQRLSRARRFVLVSLRIVAVLIACLLLLDPQIVAVKREVQPGHTLVLVDISQSMGHRDAFKHPEVADIAAAWRGLGIAEPSAVRRIDLVKGLLGRNEQQLLEKLRQNNRVLVYGFGAGVETLAVLDVDRGDETNADGGATPGDTAPPRSLDLRVLDATGSYSNLGGAIRAALGKSGAASIAGLVVLSDGRRNLGAQGPEVARLLKNRGVPHTLVLPIGDPSRTRTMRLMRVEAPEKVFQKDPFTIAAVLEGQGYENVDVNVRLKRKVASSTDEAIEVRSERVHLGEDVPEARVEFVGLENETPGVYTYLVEVEPPALEAPSPERHVQRARLEVLGEQTRVLMLSGGPTHEYRILRNLLTRDKTIELACWLTSADPNFPQDGNVSLETLPTEREDVEKYDVFIMMDPDAASLDGGFCELVAQQVLENGAGLWWVCGEKYSFDALREGATTQPIAELLPVVPDLEEAKVNIGLARGLPRPWPYILTPDGESHKITRIVEQRAASEGLWPQLPGFYFVFPVDRAKPAAQVLVAHRKPTHDDPSGEKPLIVSHFVGAGRAVFSATDDTYRWRYAYEAAYDRLWVKGIRYLFEGRLSAGNSRLKITLSEEKIELGQPIKVVVEARSASFEPLVASGFSLVLRQEDETTETVDLAPVEGLPGQFEAYLRPSETGYFRLEPTTKQDGRPVSADFQVVPAALEKEEPVDIAELSAIASVEGGELFARPDELLEAVDGGRIGSQTRIESFRNAQAVWDSMFTVGLLLGVLALEWWLRKRSNLL